MNSTSLIISLVLALMLVAPAAAQHTGDIYVGLNGTTLVTGRINPDQTITEGVRAFHAQFGDGGFNAFTSNPGFDAAFVFDPAYRIGFNILASYQYWNGSGFEATGGETLTVSFLTLSKTTATCFVPGFDLAVQSNGGWHRHLSFFLNADAKGNRDTGIYLFKLHLYYTKPGFENSEPFWIVFNYNDTPAQLDAAFAWVEANLVNPTCPADVDHSGTVNANDLLAVINAWGSAPCHPADINGDSLVNANDLLAVINSWGPCP